MHEQNLIRGGFEQRQLPFKNSEAQKLPFWPIGQLFSLLPESSIGTDTPNVAALYLSTALHRSLWRKTTQPEHHPDDGQAEQLLEKEYMSYEPLWNFVKSQIRKYAKYAKYGALWNFEKSQIRKYAKYAKYGAL